MWLLEEKHIFKVTNLKQTNRIYTAEKIKGIICCTNPFEQLIAALTFQAERAYKTFLYNCYKQEIKYLFNILNRVK